MYKEKDIMIILADKGNHSLEELSCRLEVSKTTIKRCISRMRDCGIEIKTLKGRYGGYRIESFNAEWFRK